MCDRKDGTAKMKYMIMSHKVVQNEEENLNHPWKEGLKKQQYISVTSGVLL